MTKTKLSLVVLTLCFSLISAKAYSVNGPFNFGPFDVEEEVPPKGDDPTPPKGL